MKPVKALILSIIIVTMLFPLLSTPASSAQDWVHPALRNQYPGYQKLEDRKKNSPDWQYRTNRPQGNIHGGWTVEYKDYQPVSHMPPQTRKVPYQRPYRTDGAGSNTCNCPGSEVSVSPPSDR